MKKIHGLILMLPVGIPAILYILYFLIINPVVLFAVGIGLLSVAGLLILSGL